MEIPNEGDGPWNRFRHDSLDILADALAAAAIEYLEWGSDEWRSDHAKSLHRALPALAVTGGKKNGHTLVEQVETWLGSEEEEEVIRGIACAANLGGMEGNLSRLQRLFLLAEREEDWDANWALGGVYASAPPEQQAWILDFLFFPCGTGIWRAARIQRVIFPVTSPEQQVRIWDRAFPMAKKGDGEAMSLLVSIFPCVAPHLQALIQELLLAQQESDGLQLWMIYPAAIPEQQERILDYFFGLAERGNFEALSLQDNVFSSATLERQRRLFETMLSMAGQEEEALSALVGVFPSLSTDQQARLTAYLLPLASQGGEEALRQLGYIFSSAEMKQQAVMRDCLLLQAEQGNRGAMWALSTVYDSVSSGQQARIWNCLTALAAEGEDKAMEALGEIYPSATSEQQAQIIAWQLALADKRTFRTMRTLEKIFPQATPAQQARIVDSLLPDGRAKWEAISALGEFCLTASSAQQARIVNSLLFWAGAMKNEVAIKALQAYWKSGGRTIRRGGEIHATSVTELSAPPPFLRLVG